MDNHWTKWRTSPIVTWILNWGWLSCCTWSARKRPSCEDTDWGKILGPVMELGQKAMIGADDWGQSSWVVAGDFGWHGCAHSYIMLYSYTHIPQSLGWSWLGWCMLMCILTWPGGFHLVSTSPSLSGSACRSCQKQSNYTQYLNVCCGCEVYPLPLLWYHTIVNFTLRYSHFNQQYFALLRSSPLLAVGILQAQKACDSRSDFFQHRKGGRAKA